jgi:hypothetical protein
MPISPDRMARYPGGSIRSPEWQRLRAKILSRAGFRCEGRPGYPPCRVPNGEPHPITGAIVVLTIGHVDQDETNNDDDNLRAWCQRCHNSWDAPHRAANARWTRYVKRTRGQLDLFGNKLVRAHPVGQRALRLFSGRA